MRGGKRKGETGPGANRSVPGSAGIGEVLSGTVEKIVPGGDGLLRSGGQVIFVPFVIPGEQVLVRTTHRGKGFLRAELLELLSASPDRRTPPCPLFTRCGGCNLQHMSYPRQLSVKQEIVMDAFQRTGRMQLERPPIEASDELYYRNRVQIHRRSDGALGFMRRDSNEVIEVRHCCISLPPVNQLFESQPAGMPARFNAFAWKDSLWTDSGNSGDGPITVELSGRSLKFSLSGFFQSNLGVLEKLVSRVSALAAAVPKHRTVVDLYAGAGLFGSFLSERFERVISVEQNPAAAAMARENVRGSGHEFHTRNVDHWVSEQLAAGSGALTPDLVLADPPRTGLSEPVRAYLTGSGVQVFLYVSCDPVTLARDAARLVAGGFRLESLTLYDFYPQTSHIESFAVFTRS